MWLWLLVCCYSDQLSSIIYQSDSGILSICNIKQGVQIRSKQVSIIGGEQIYAALQLYNLAQQKNLKIDTIDISEKNYIVVTLITGQKFRINWLDMGQDTQRSHIDLESRLEQIALVFSVKEASGIRSLTLTNNYNTVRKTSGLPGSPGNLPKASR